MLCGAVSLSVIEVDTTVEKLATIPVYTEGDLFKDVSSYEAELWGISQIYKNRVKDDFLCDLAKDRAKYKSAFDKNTPHEGVQTQVYRHIESNGYMHAGENLAFGKLLPHEHFDAWLRSATHKANLDNPAHTNSCVKCRYDTSENMMYCVQLFAGY